MDKGLESRFERYAEVLVKTLGHADRATPARWYLRGLMLPGERKSVASVAAQVHPEDVRSAHQSMHHLVADSEWSDKALLAAVAGARGAGVEPRGTGGVLLDYRRHGVRANTANTPLEWLGNTAGSWARRRTAGVAVSLSLATPEGSVPLDYRLYLPREWAEDKERREPAGVPEDIAFATKGEIAWSQIEAALDAGIARGTVLMDAGYGDEAAMRDRLTAHGLPYAVGIRLQTAVWCDQAKRDRPLSVLELARMLPPADYRTITWREGTNQRLSSRFARVRVRAAHGKRAREQEWLLIEWPKGEAEPTRYFLSTLPDDISFKKLVGTVKMRWRIERDYLELKQEVGLGHYEGRNWRGFHHHASLCIAAYGFLMLERLRGREKNSARLKAPFVPKGFQPRGSQPDAAAQPVVDRERALSTGSGHCPATCAMSVLRETVRASI